MARREREREKTELDIDTKYAIRNHFVYITVKHTIL